jgi:protein KRI1
VKELHAAAESSDEDEEMEDKDGGFLIRKEKQPAEESGRPQPALNKADIDAAEKDPENYLSKFLDSRAWVAPQKNILHPFESDEDEDDKAEEFEAAYNLRFENPQAANERLVAHSREAAAKYSVRQEPTNKRKRAREAEQAKKDEQKQQTVTDKARLRKLRLEEAEQKINKIKEAAGLGKKPVNIEDWQDFLTEDWDDKRWEAEMKKQFGEDYYAEGEVPSSDEEGAKKRKAKKPKWDDDIDIGDLVGDFDAGDNAKFSLSEAEASSSKKKSKQRAKEKEEEKREARKQRRKIEALVDEKLDVDFAIDGAGKKGAKSVFRYRETSPGAFGLTPKDILLASDSQLNQFHGLKKLAAYRDEDKKRKDKKHLGKKARLRQWRRDTFGNEAGPQKTLQDLLREAQGEPEAPQTGVNAEEVRTDIREGKRRKRSKKH